MAGKGGLKFTPKFFALVLLVACMVMVCTIIRDGFGLKAQSKAIAQLEEQKAEMKLKNERLKSEAEFTDTDEYMEQQARMRGMIKSDETRYVLSTGVSDSYAQGGN